MAFPTVSDFLTQKFGAVTSHQVNMPATMNAGDLLCMFSCFNAGGSRTDPAGWVLQINDFSAGVFQGEFYTRAADGTEGGTTVNVGTTDPAAGVAQVFRITGWSGTAADIKFAATAVSEGANPDPPGLALAAAADVLWLAVVLAGDDNASATAFPTNYTDGTSTTSDTGGNNSAQIYSARRELNAASENPGAFTLPQSEGWYTLTVAIPPAAGGAVTLSGTLASDSTLTGSIDARPGLSGSIASTSSMSGALEVVSDLLLSGQISAHSTASGTLGMLMGVSGGLSSTSDADALLGLVQSLSGDAQSQSHLSGALVLSAQMLLSGSVASTSEISGSAGLDMGLTGDIDSISALMGAAWLDLALSGQVQAASELQGALTGVEGFGTLTVDAITLQAVIDGSPALKAALEAAISIKPEGEA